MEISARLLSQARELFGQVANLFIVITRHRKDLLAANLLAVLQSLRLAPDAEIPKGNRGCHWP
jgi:hypothetical protein